MRKVNWKQFGDDFMNKEHTTSFGAMVLIAWMAIPYFEDFRARLVAILFFCILAITRLATFKD